ncbi:MAG: hypothetical protein AAF682_29550 [Planctomycetota bacterium]
MRSLLAATPLVCIGCVPAALSDSSSSSSSGPGKPPCTDQPAQFHGALVDFGTAGENIALFDPCSPAGGPILSLADALDFRPRVQVVNAGSSPFSLGQTFEWTGEYYDSEGIKTLSLDVQRDEDGAALPPEGELLAAWSDIEDVVTFQDWTDLGTVYHFLCGDSTNAIVQVEGGQSTTEVVDWNLMCAMRAVSNTVVSNFLGFRPSASASTWDVVLADTFSFSPIVVATSDFVPACVASLPNGVAVLALDNDLHRLSSATGLTDLGMSWLDLVLPSGSGWTQGYGWVHLRRAGSNDYEIWKLSDAGDYGQVGGSQPGTPLEMQLIDGYAVVRSCQAASCQGGDEAVVAVDLGSGQAVPLDTAEEIQLLPMTSDGWAYYTKIDGGTTYAVAAKVDGTERSEEVDSRWICGEFDVRNAMTGEETPLARVLLAAREDPGGDSITMRLADDPSVIVRELGTLPLGYRAYGLQNDGCIAGPGRTTFVFTAAEVDSLGEAVQLDTFQADYEVAGSLVRVTDTPQSDELGFW